MDIFMTALRIKLARLIRETEIKTIPLITEIPEGALVYEIPKREVMPSGER